MRRNGTVLPVIFAALILLGTAITPGIVTEAAAGPASPQVTQITQSLGNSPYSTQEQMTRAQAVMRDHPTGDALNRLGEEGKQLAVTNASSPPLSKGALAVSPIDDPVTWAECDANINNHGEDGYWYKNKFYFCRTARVTLYYRELINNVPVVVGATAITVQLKGSAIKGQSGVVFAMRMYDFQDKDKTHKEFFFSLKLPCSNADTSRTSNCSESSGAITTYRKTVAEWQGLAGTEFTWIENAVTTAVPAHKYAKELRGFFAAGLYMVLESPLAGPQVETSPPVLFRCDSAAYVFGSKCAFPNVTSVLEFRASDQDISESAQFIRDAQTDITLTKPGHFGKKVPGALGDLPLHRLHSSYDGNGDIKATTRKVPKTCRLYWGPKYTVNKTKQCDEYPFKTTYENAARVDTSTNYDYAVRAISASHNETAGRRYGAWLGADRILDGDPFFVRIVP